MFNRQTLLGIVLALIAGISWGAMASCVQFLLTDTKVGAIELVTLRQLGAGILFVGGALMLRVPNEIQVVRNWRDFRDVVIAGGLVYISHSAFFEAISFSNAGTGAIFLAAVPLATAVILALWTKRPIRLLEFITFFVVMLGILLIMTGGDFSGLKFSIYAVFWGGVSIVSSAIYSIQPHSVVRRLGVTLVVSWGMLFAGCMAALTSQPWGLELHWTLSHWAAYGFVVVFGTILAFWCYLMSVKLLNPVFVGILISSEPISAYVFSIIFLGVELGVFEIAGIAIVIVAVSLYSLKCAKN